MLISQEKDYNKEGNCLLLDVIIILHIVLG